MVLPPSVADDASGPDVTGWLRRLKVILELSRAGVLVLVDHAHLERLGDLVRALLPTHPELEVHSDARKLVGVKPGSTVVLVPRTEDADWLNINRPLFALNGLRVVLFAPREVSVALARGAVDFFDWISHRLECPPGPAPFAVAGLRRALAIRAPGIVWKGGDLVAAFRAVRPRRKLRTISAARPYEELVAEVLAGGRDWLAWSDVDGEFRLRRVRWALAEARCRTRTILVEPAVPSPGWWEVHGRVAEFGLARDRLERARALHPGRLAALVDLEVEAIELLGALLERGLPEQVLEAEMVRAADAGAEVGRAAIVQDLVSVRDLVRSKTSPPVVRASSEDRAQLHRLQEGEVKALVQKLEQGERLELEDTAWLTASAKQALEFWELSDGFGRQGHVAEVSLRHRLRTAGTWQTLAGVALVAGDLQVAYLWAQRAAELDPGGWMMLAQVLAEQGKWAEAEALFRQRLTATPDSKHQWVLYELARVLQKQGRYTEAEEVLRQVLASHARTPGDAPPFYASMHELARVLEQQGRYAEAEVLLRQALAIEEKVLSVSHPHYAASQYVLAGVLERQGRYAEAEGLLAKVLPLEQKALGIDHPHYAMSLREMARVLERQGRYTEAEGLLRQVLAILGKAIGEAHPDYATALHELARALERQGSYAEAERLLQQGLSVLEKTLSIAHPQYALALHGLARVHEWQGRYVEAEKQLRQVLATLEKTLGVAHPYFALALHELARVQGRQGYYVEAEGNLRQVLATLEKTLGMTHPRYAASLRELARVLELQGRYAEAEGLLRRGLAIQEASLGATHPELCAALTLLGFTLTKQNRSEEGELLLQRSVKVALATWGLNHPVTAQALHRLAVAQSSLKKAEAVATARQAMEAFLKSLGPEHPLTKEALPELNLILERSRSS